jgi:hypothetical protein
MAPNHPDHTFWKDEAGAIGNLTTTDIKQDAFHHEKAISAEDPEFKLVASPFEEKTEEERKLVRKIDLYLMPTIWVLYCFSYMVRQKTVTAASNANKLPGPNSDRQRKSRRHG